MGEDQTKQLYADVLLADVNIIDVTSKRIYPGSVAIKNGEILGVGKVDHLVGPRTVVHDFSGFYISPSFIDAHVHIESSLLTLTEFAKAAIPHGTTSIISDPHEIANVLGSDGIRPLLDEARSLPLKAFFTAPSCVPASPNLETSAFELDEKEVRNLLRLDRVVGLGEVMDFKGLIAGNQQLLEKVRAARSLGKVVDGHAPKLTGRNLREYVGAGVQSDHECTSGEEALEKHELGLWIMVREGSASKDLRNVMQPFLQGDLPKDRLMLVPDDLNPIDLTKGHLNNLIRRAVEEGVDPLSAIQMVTINPATYFHLDRETGSIDPGKRADLVVFQDLQRIVVKAVFADGRMVAKDGRLIGEIPAHRYPEFTYRTMNPKYVPRPKDYIIKAPMRSGIVRVRAIAAEDLSLITELKVENLQVEGFQVYPSIEEDLLYIAVVERHRRTGNIGKGFIHGFGLNKGAMASSVAHDSHNIIVVGTNGTDMSSAVERIVETSGGIAVSVKGQIAGELKLPIAGLLSEKSADYVVEGLEKLHEKVRMLGCRMKEPFMTMSFMALPVIPEIKVTDKGLLDVGEMIFVDPIICH